MPCPAGAFSAGTHRRSKAVTAIASFCSAPSRIADDDACNRCARRAGRRCGASGCRPGLRALHIARRARERRSSKAATATLLSVLEISPQRVEPACRHFGECGGCVIQHLADEPYRAWKRDKVVQSLAMRGIAGNVSAKFSLSAAVAAKGNLLGPQVGRRRRRLRLQQGGLSHHYRHRRMPHRAAGDRGSPSRCCVRSPRCSAIRARHSI